MLSVSPLSAKVRTRHERKVSLQRGGDLCPAPENKTSQALRPTQRIGANQADEAQEIQEGQGIVAGKVILSARQRFAAALPCQLWGSVPVQRVNQHRFILGHL